MKKVNATKKEREAYERKVKRFIRTSFKYQADAIAATAWRKIGQRILFDLVNPDRTAIASLRWIVAVRRELKHALEDTHKRFIKLVKIAENHYELDYATASAFWLSEDDALLQRLSNRLPRRGCKIGFSREVAKNS